MAVKIGFENVGFEKNAKLIEKASLQNQLNQVTNGGALFAKAPIAPKAVDTAAATATVATATATAGTDAAAFANELKANFDEYQGKNFDEIAKKVSEKLGIPADQVEIGKAEDGQKTIEVNGQVALKDSNGNGTLEKEDLEVNKQLETFAADLKKFQQNKVDADTVANAKKIQLEGKINAIDNDIQRLDKTAKDNGVEQKVLGFGARKGSLGTSAA